MARNMTLIEVYQSLIDPPEKQVVKVGDTAFECVVTLGRDLFGDDIVLTADYSLNGKKRTTVARMARWNYSKEAAVRLLRDEMAREIATTVLLTGMDQLHRQMDWSRIGRK